MELFINYWYVVVGIIALLTIGGIAVYKFAGLPTKSQIEKIRKWLLYAVTKAETELGANTGQLKLHTVYDLFLSKFPVAGKLVTFETFSLWVDNALDDMKEMLDNNEKIEALVKGEELIEGTK